MNEINARLIQVLVGFGYFNLIIAICFWLMKFFGKYLAKIATVFLIWFPMIGILGGAIEWIITGFTENIKINFL